MDIPDNVKKILKKIKKEGWQAYLVGGCVRDLEMEKTPKDWDVATDAVPEEIQKIFPESFCNNEFGTVNVSGVEITPFRTEEKYTDKRHPDKVKWSKNIEEDLARRDFTINAMALGADEKTIIDPYKGKEDIKRKIIRAVGSPEDRFEEDSLRMMRAVRIASVLGFKIEPKTSSAIKKNSSWITSVSKERIRDELSKAIMSENAAPGIELLRELRLLEHIIPELLEGYKVGQNKHHLYDCYEHSIKSLDYSAKKGFNFHVRMASLMHDIGKPRTKQGKGEKATFYNHELVGARMTREIMQRLKFPKKDIEKVERLVRYHLFYYNVGEVSESSVRRLLRNAGPENIEELLQVRYADRVGSGCPKAEPYKLRHLKYLIDKVSKDPISVKMLKVNGQDIMEMLSLKPGPAIGKILDILLGEVLKDPSKNDKDYLKKEIERINVLTEKELDKKAEDARKEIDQVQVKEDKMTKDKYWVT
ncbi:MAG: hypothetical protein A2365_01505 [Candidatus Nealsonbacteria bacterium RIFOXYB1_FULL_40_15]|uniref:HD domain-containing protein n=2 Tax=Candidatus Nealsoniibacteriota TaxID=1817911 RepID=A0A1G2EMD4_9BACT|nr:MAG: hypothetical protein A2427_00045 [Candidatus Nealsonbacteria bacterium RIFOXYC1_FULL_40_7]OGZ27250.1 MAG: hypothetical protein A2365_01505 [Candidatus Nealsonbacteria bacterium RIFOXYB1_FULL_40_15]OGZ29287.1 MAG: hypothetical protein A2562_02735 [Candidatus Nealsonbacteria bacterium RIFOXYD1_FULL_39_11]